MTYDEFSKMVDEVFPYDEGFYQIIDCDDYIEDTPIEVYYHPKSEISLELCAKYLWWDNPTREEMEKDKERMKELYKERLLRFTEGLK